MNVNDETSVPILYNINQPPEKTMFMTIAAIIIFGSTAAYLVASMVQGN
jgi:hypothetical protein